MSLKAGFGRSTARRACGVCSLSCRKRRQTSLRAAPAVFRPRPRFRSPAKLGSAEGASPNPQPPATPDDRGRAGTPAYQCMRMDFVSRLKRSGRSKSQPMVARPDGPFPRVKTCLGALMGFARKPRGSTHRTLAATSVTTPSRGPNNAAYPQLSLNRLSLPRGGSQAPQAVPRRPEKPKRPPMALMHFQHKKIGKRTHGPRAATMAINYITRYEKQDREAGAEAVNDSARESAASVILAGRMPRTGTRPLDGSKNGPPKTG